MLLKYKGIKFDYFKKDEFGAWSNICKNCQNRYKDFINAEVDNIGGNSFVCGVKGCTNESNEKDYNNVEVNYIDIDLELSEIF